MIKWDKPCYKCLSHFCDLSCKEPKHLQTPQRSESSGKPSAWVGLTDEEIDDLWESTASYYNTHDFARAIEAKLKQKNGYAEEKDT